MDNFKEAAWLGLSHVSVTGAWGDSGIDAYNPKHAAFAEADLEEIEAMNRQASCPNLIGSL